jgi:hypothetical protein
MVGGDVGASVSSSNSPMIFEQVFHGDHPTVAPVVLRGLGDG